MLNINYLSFTQNELKWFFPYIEEIPKENGYFCFPHFSAVFRSVRVLRARNIFLNVVHVNDEHDCRECGKMKAGSKTYLLLGIGGAFVCLMNLAELLSGQGDLLDIFAACFFTLLSAEGFISYLRIKGKTTFHFIS